VSVFDEISSIYDLGMLPLELLVFRRLRRRIFPALRGRILEIGVGTGANVGLYAEGTDVYACDASESVLQVTRQHSPSWVRLLLTDAQRLPFPDGIFDVVTASLVFCSIADPHQGLSEARRVLAAEGRLVLLEHMRGLPPLGDRLTDLFHPVWHSWSRECHLNRETVQTVEQAGFTIESVRSHLFGIVREIEARNEEQS